MNTRRLPRALATVNSAPAASLRWETEAARYFTETSSTSKMSVAFAGMGPPGVPRSP